ncbi:DUF4355 domain-containing protein [Candidatus Enterococcus clewellii]|uniref:Phage scaffold protein n=1 Tax=Candidatus Enterococcus clewellii TaxID=1834193 RepID=A0A242K486_9ENTE|nr:DUF4355 domain-containing protein [Enterococcus sp. 9E7_DIV0242]OTP13432.1 hypothetical protein A5888_002910 [Enterococcus sp. 9E7_DIV0242]
MKRKLFLPMHLQFFSADTGSEGQSTSSQESQSTKDSKTENNEQDKNENTGKTFSRDDVAKMMSAEKAKWEKDQEQRIETAKNEAARLAKLSKDEREKEEEKSRLADIEKREAALRLGELRIETITQLEKSGVPVDFCDMVLTDDAEQIKTNIAAVKKTFDAAVEKKVDERLKQSTPRIASSSSGMTKAEIMAVKDSSERQKLIAENRNLF